MRVFAVNKAYSPKKVMKILAAILTVTVTLALGVRVTPAADGPLYVTFVDNFGTVNESATVKRAENGHVARFLSENNLGMTPSDVVNHPLDTPVYNGMIITVRRSFPVTLRVHNGSAIVQPHLLHVLPGTLVHQAVESLGQILGKEFIWDESLRARAATPDMVIDLHTVNGQAPAYQDLPQNPPQTPPQVNEQSTQHSFSYSGGVPILIGDSFPHPVPVPRPTHLVPGISNASFALGDGYILVNGTQFSITRHMEMGATAYTADFASTGRRPGDRLFGITASGLRAQVGVVAVDTDVIPMFTLLYIEDYGFAIAGDRGSAIRGYKVDLFFNTAAEARQFGRQTINVFILENQYLEISLID